MLRLRTRVDIHVFVVPRARSYCATREDKALVMLRVGTVDVAFSVPSRALSALESIFNGSCASVTFSRQRRMRAAVGSLALLIAILHAGSGAPGASAASAQSCLTPRASRALSHAVAGARDRYHREAVGPAAHKALRGVVADRRFVHDLAAARAEADRLLVHHLVRLRVVRGSRVLVSANRTSFSVAGLSRTLRSPDGYVLGRVSVFRM